MIIRSVRHPLLRRVISDDRAPYLGRGMDDRVRKVLAALMLAVDIRRFIADAPPGWRIELVSGRPRGAWRVSASEGWRITFEEEGGYIDRLNLEDYH